MFRTVIVASLLVVAVCSTAFANPRIDSIDLAVMRAVAERLGHEVTGERTLDDGTQVVQAREPGGLNYALVALACGEGPCRGMASLVEFENESGLTADTVNQINRNWAAAKVVLHDSSIEFSRYDIADGGTSVEALAASVNVLIEVTYSVLEASR